MRIVLTLVCLTCLGCGSSTTDEQAFATISAAVVSGAKAPNELGIIVSRLERNAALGELVRVNGQTVGGCSGTLVGDRAVVSASHCVVMNQEDWVKGAAPRIVKPDAIFYAAGSDINNPICLLKAESVHIHPEAEPVNGEIHHDVSMTILQESALAACPDTVPIAINRETLSDSIVGEILLQGGFGSTDTSGNYSAILYWSALAVTVLDSGYITCGDANKGFPSYGDSGSGLLRRFPDKSLRNLGVLSAGSYQKKKSYFARLDVESPFFDKVLQGDVVCGAVTSKGTCKSGAIVRCAAEGFSSTDCQETHQDCALDANGDPFCVCTCDATAHCDSDCLCDRDCSCRCDTAEGCNPGCSCDAECDPAVPEAGADAGLEEDSLEERAGLDSDGAEGIDGRANEDRGIDSGSKTLTNVSPSNGDSSCSLAPMLGSVRWGWVLLIGGMAIRLGRRLVDKNRFRS